MAADGEGAAHKGAKRGCKEGLKEGQKKGQWQSKKELEQFWELVIGISKRQADCF